jgi:hypothetical protein
MLKSTVTFDRSLIAPCGMNCGTCIAYLREKNRCPGCRIYSANKAISIQRCIIPKCIHLENTHSKFCYDCVKYPCKRLNQLDKRYRTKYNTSFFENLTMIKEKGIDSFLVFEKKRRTCPDCGSVLSVHRNSCLICKNKLDERR